VHLNVDVKNYKLKAQLVPNAMAIKPIYKRRVSPWRTIMVSDDARAIVSSK
jgi:hypothetical protein